MVQIVGYVAVRVYFESVFDSETDIKIMAVVVIIFCEI